MSLPSARGWGPGWPNCQTDKWITVELAPGIRLPVRRELAKIFAYACHETEKHYDIKPGQTWTAACRAVRRRKSPSEHSWSMAIDLNAPANPMIQGRLVCDFPHAVPGIWKSLGFTWGGDYGRNYWNGSRWVGEGPYRYDAMHFGYGLTPTDAARTTASLTSPVGPLKLTKTLHVGDKGKALAPIISHVQDLLRFYGARYKVSACNVKTDGNYGPATGAGMLAHKRAVYNLQEAFGAPLTFHRPVDNTCGRIALGSLEYWTHAK